MPDLLASIDAGYISRLILVDGFSQDQTVSIARRWASRHDLPIDVLEVKGRGAARLEGLRHAKTEWVFMFDSDVILAPNWFSAIDEHIGPDVGAVWAVEDPQGDPYRTVYDVMQSWYQLPRELMSYISERYYTHAIVIRRDPALEIMSSATYQGLYVFEDHYLGLKLTQMGYHWVKCTTTNFIHNSRKRRWSKDLYGAGYFGAAMGFYRLRHIARGLLLGPIKSAVMISSGRAKVGLWNYYAYLLVALGFTLARIKGEVLP